MYGFGERKTPKPFVAACDKFIYTENLAYPGSPTVPGDAALKPKPATSAAQLKADTALVNQLRNAIDAASDDDGWAPLANVGHIITKQRSDFDSRNYGYAKLSELLAATTLFERLSRLSWNLGDGPPPETCHGVGTRVNDQEHLEGDRREQELPERQDRHESAGRAGDGDRGAGRDCRGHARGAAGPRGRHRAAGDERDHGAGRERGVWAQGPPRR